MSPEPKQRPRRSKQDYGTPENFLTPVKRRLGITEFAFDFAADRSNAKAEDYWTKRDDSLSKSPQQWVSRIRYPGEWGWLNPEFAVIAPWAERCRQVRELGGSIALLVPAGIGSNWFRDQVDGHALVLALNGRLAFMPDKPTWLYPKDCILCLYSPAIVPGFEVWSWRR